MRILAVSDMHGNMRPVKELMRQVRPDVLLCCGDWGDPGQVSIDEYEEIIRAAYVATVFGNHDDLNLLSRLKNKDGSPVMLQNGIVREVLGVRLSGISGIWAKSHSKPWYVTDEEVVAAGRTAGAEGVEILMTHGCAIGLCDGLPGGRRGGQRCFLDAFHEARPEVYLCGHLHVQQMKMLKDGRIAANIGYTAQGDYMILERTEQGWNVNPARI